MHKPQSSYGGITKVRMEMLWFTKEKVQYIKCPVRGGNYNMKHLQMLSYTWTCRKY